MASLEDMIVKLIGDTSQYQQSMNAAAAITQRTGQVIEQSLNNAMAASTAATLNTAVGQQRLSRDLAATTNSLTTQALTFGMTSRQAQVYALELRGATAAQTEQARAADAYLTRLELQRAQEQATAKAATSLEAQKTAAVLRNLKEQEAAVQSLAQQKQRAYEQDLKAQQRAVGSLDQQRQRAYEQNLRAQQQAVDALARQKQRAYEQELKAQEQLEKRTIERINREIKAETDKAIAAAKAYNQQQDAQRAQTLQQGQGVATAVFEAAVDFAKKAVGEFSSFDLAMTRSTSIMEITTEQVKVLRGAVLSLSLDTIFDPTELGKGLYYLASAGLNAEQALLSLPAVTQFATAGAMDLSRAVDLAVAATTAFGLSSNNAQVYLRNMTDVMDIVTRASKLSLGTTEQYARALTRDAAAAARAYNISLEDVVATLAVYHKSGLQGAIAGNTFGRAVRLLANAATIAGDEFKRMGIRVFDESGKFRKMSDIMADFERRLGGLSDEARAVALTKLGLETLAQKAVLPLIGASKQLDEFYKKLRLAGGTTKDIAEKQMQAFANQMLLVNNAIKVVWISLGQELAPTIVSLTTNLRDLIKWWIALDETTQSTTKTVIGFLASVILVPAAVMAIQQAVILLGQAFIALTTAMLANPMVQVIAGVVLLGIAIHSIIDYFSGATSSAKEFNDALAKSIELQNALDRLGTRRQKEAVRAIKEQPDTEKQKGMIQSELDRVIREQDAIKQRKQNIRRELIDLTSGLSGEINTIGEGIWRKIPLIGSGGRRSELLEELEALNKSGTKNTEWAKELKELFEQINPAPLIKITKLMEERDKMEFELKKKIMGVGISKDEVERNKLASEGLDVTAIDALLDRLKQRQQFDEMDRSAASMIEKLKETIATFGATSEQVEFYKLMIGGASQEQLDFAASLSLEVQGLNEKKKLMEEGVRITKDSLSPQEKFGERQLELKKLLDAGAITADTYQKAMAKAAKELSHVSGEGQKVTSVLAHSNEAMRLFRLQMDTGVMPIGELAGYTSKLKKPTERNFVEEYLGIRMEQEYLNFRDSITAGFGEGPEKLQPQMESLKRQIKYAEEAANIAEQNKFAARPENVARLTEEWKLAEDKVQELYKQFNDLMDDAKVLKRERELNQALDTPEVKGDNVLELLKQIRDFLQGIYEEGGVELDEVDIT